MKNHIVSNTVEHKHTIVRTMQTMGIFNEDEDSDTFLDQDEIVDTPPVNKISDESSCPDTDTATSSADFHKIQINTINTHADNLKDNIIPLLEVETANISAVKVHTIHDDAIDRLAYDTDMYMMEQSIQLCLKMPHLIIQV